MSHPSTFLISLPQTRSVSSCTVRILPLCGFYPRLRCHEGISVCLFPPPPDYWYAFSFFLAQVQVPCTKPQGFGVFARSMTLCKYVFILISYFNPSYISKCSTSLTVFLNASLSLCFYPLFWWCLVPSKLLCAQYIFLVPSSRSLHTFSTMMRYLTLFQLAL